MFKHNIAIWLGFAGFFYIQGAAAADLDSTNVVRVKEIVLDEAFRFILNKGHITIKNYADEEYRYFVLAKNGLAGNVPPFPPRFPLAIFADTRKGTLTVYNGASVSQEMGQYTISARTLMELNFYGATPAWAYRVRKTSKQHPMIINDDLSIEFDGITYVYDSEEFDPDLDGDGYESDIVEVRSYQENLRPNIVTDPDTDLDEPSSRRVENREARARVQAEMRRKREERRHLKEEQRRRKEQQRRTYELEQQREEAKWKRAEKRAKQSIINELFNGGQVSVAIGICTARTNNTEFYYSAAILMGVDGEGNQVKFSNVERRLDLSNFLD